MCNKILVLAYIAGIKTNIKKSVKIINNTQTTNEAIAIALFFLKTPNVTPKSANTKKANKIIVKLNEIPPFVYKLIHTFYHYQTI
jgi:hypothetical protein